MRAKQNIEEAIQRSIPGKTVEQRQEVWKYNEFLININVVFVDQTVAVFTVCATQNVFFNYK